MELTVLGAELGQFHSRRLYNGSDSSLLLPSIFKDIRLENFLNIVCKGVYFCTVTLRVETITVNSRCARVLEDAISVTHTIPVVVKFGNSH